MNILVLNDMHIPAPWEDFHGRDGETIFRRTLAILMEQSRPDLLLLNGDLCAFDPQAETYQAIAALLNEYSVPTLAIPGNHDDPALMQQHLPLPADTAAELGCSDIRTLAADPYCGWARLGNYGIAWLNTFNQRLSEPQQEWLRSQGPACSAPQGTLLFMHHPPVHVPCRFMEARFPLRDREAAMESITRLPNIRRIFCGHYHRRFEHPQAPVTMVSSSLYTMDPDSENHHILHWNPGYARIELGSELRYTVAELPENMLQM